MGLAPEVAMTHCGPCYEARCKSRTDLKCMRQGSAVVDWWCDVYKV